MAHISRAASDEMLDALIGVIDATPKGRRRKRILGAAAQLFIDQGYKKTRMDEVAQRVGMSKVTVYAYYPTKVALLSATIALEKKAFMRGMDAVFDRTVPAEQRLRALLEGMLSYALQMPVAARLIKGGELAAVMAELPPHLLSRGSQMRNDFIGGLLREATGSATEDAISLVSSLAHFAVVILQPHVRGELSVKRYVEALAATLLAGLKENKRGGKR